uniref:Uncharacterized protein n=1 Tax=Cacopsylla melanoneura TaxID=428564 RepID=A0A8D8TUH6_9HEMI
MKIGFVSFFLGLSCFWVFWCVGNSFGFVLADGFTVLVMSSSSLEESEDRMSYAFLVETLNSVSLVFSSVSSSSSGGLPSVGEVSALGVGVLSHADGPCLDVDWTFVVFESSAISLKSSFLALLSGYEDLISGSFFGVAALFPPLPLATIAGDGH